MLFHEFEAEAAELFIEHLPNRGRGYEVRYDTKVGRLGAFYYNDRVFVFSTRLLSTQRSFEGLLKDTVLHEIAHALAYQESGDTGHGPAWKAKAIRLGTSPSATTDWWAPLKYIRTCPFCSYRFEADRILRSVSCGVCHEELHRTDPWEYNEDYVPPQPGWTKRVVDFTPKGPSVASRPWNVYR